MKSRKNILKMVLAGFFFALGYVLPFLTGQIAEIGSMLAPMHLPVFLAGFISGPVWGGVVGFVLPLFRSLTLGAPLLFPKAVCMAFELATYGAVAGILHRILPAKRIFIYCSLVSAMLVGRAVWGLATFICLGAVGGRLTLSAFIASAFTGALPGIIIQVVLVPIIVMLAENSKILRSGD